MTEWSSDPVTMIYHVNHAASGVDAASYIDAARALAVQIQLELPELVTEYFLVALDAAQEGWLRDQHGRLWVEIIAACLVKAASIHPANSLRDVGPLLRLAALVPEETEPCRAHYSYDYICVTCGGTDRALTAEAIDRIHVIMEDDDIGGHNSDG